MIAGESGVIWVISKSWTPFAVGGDVRLSRPCGRPVDSSRMKVCLPGPYIPPTRRNCIAHGEGRTALAVGVRGD